MHSEELLAGLCRALADAWESGSPLAGSNESIRSRLADVAIRRLRSSSRRGVDVTNTEHRVRDLAQGLIAQLETHPKLVGRLRVDYEHVARMIRAMRRADAGAARLGVASRS